MDELDILVKKFANGNDEYNFSIYRTSVKQKFWSLSTYYELIYNLNATSLPEFGGDGITSTGTLSGGIVNIEEFNKYINMYFDGFVINAKSSLDSLAHASNILYPAIIKDEVYFNQDFITNITNKTTKFFNLVKDIPNQQWFKDLSDFRNVTTHERLVEAKIVATFTTASGKVQDVKIFLPDNIRATKLTWNGRNGLYPTCDIFKKEIENLLIQIKNAMVEDLKTFKKVPI